MAIVALGKIDANEDDDEEEEEEGDFFFKKKVNSLHLGQ